LGYFYVVTYPTEFPNRNESGADVAADPQFAPIPQSHYLMQKIKNCKFWSIYRHFVGQCDRASICVRHFLP